MDLFCIVRIHGGGHGDVGLISSVFDDFSDGFGFVLLGLTAEDIVTLVNKQCTI